MRDGVVRLDADNHYRLTHEGARRARLAARNHRLWELYLITHADVAPSRVDQDADDIEHVLEPEIVAELERLLDARLRESGVVSNPHAVAGGG